MRQFLVIEDNAENLELMVYLLEAFGHSVARATDGEQGLAEFEREPFEVVVCDLQMPGLSGFDVVRRIRAGSVHPGARVVAVTALAMVGDRERILAQGFDGYIPKPIDPRTFVQQVAVHLPGASGSEALVSAPVEAGAEPTRPVRNGTGRGRKVLVVDDLPENRELARCLLEAEGYAIGVAFDVPSALAALAAESFDLVLCDVYMPRAKGHELLERMREDPKLRPIPFVFLSSTVWREEDRRRALELGAFRFLMRPIEPEVLFSTLDQILADMGKPIAGDPIR